MSWDVVVVTQFRGRHGGWQVETWAEQSERSQIELPSGPCIARCRKSESQATKQSQTYDIERSFFLPKVPTPETVTAGPIKFFKPLPKRDNNDNTKGPPSLRSLRHLHTCAPLFSLMWYCSAVASLESLSLFSSLFFQFWRLCIFVCLLFIVNLLLFVRLLHSSLLAGQHQLSLGQFPSLLFFFSISGNTDDNTKIVPFQYEGGYEIRKMISLSACYCRWKAPFTQMPQCVGHDCVTVCCTHLRARQRLWWVPSVYATVHCICAKRSDMLGTNKFTSLRSSNDPDLSQLGRV